MSDRSHDDLFPLIVGGVHILPVLHERLEYADWVRLALERLRPDAVAVEIPSSLENLWVKAVDRLPSLAVLLYENSSGQTIYLPVQPADPMVEAARTARRLKVELRCVDLDVDGYADYRDPVPDSYTLLRLGLPSVYRTFCELKRVADPLDARREASMAYHVQQLCDAGAERVLLVCGMHHGEGIVEQLGREQAAPLTPPRRAGARLVHLHPESLGEVLREIPFQVAVYEERREKRPDPVPAKKPVPAARSHGAFRVLSGGGQDDETRVREAIKKAAAESGGDPPGPLDRLRSQWAMLREAEQALVAAAPDEEVQRWQRVNLARFSRNLALASGQLLPDLFDLLAAARSCVSDNYAWELHRLATAYPRQGMSAELPTALIRADEMFVGTRRLSIHRRLRKPKRPDWRSLLRRRRRSEAFKGEWLEGFDSDAICSYPPEDIVIEDFGRYLKGRGKSILSEERARSVPFSASILDGIDVRETIRNWSEGRIYVRELGRAPGGVGSIVVICDENPDAYPYEQTWLGEHDQESDMAFYSTEPAQGIIGPGICRVTYGGLLLSYPPQRMFDVWGDPDYRMAETQAEVLLLAALDYTVEPIVVHVAKRPPRSVFHQLARRLGLKILHLPIGTLSPATIRRIRVMHVLSGHDKRKVARDYIW